MIALGRRAFVAGAAGLAALPAAAMQRPDGRTLYGLIGKMRAATGQRDALIDILLAGTGAMPGCLSYVVARDPADADAIWITEVWDSEASHRASLQLPQVRDAITRARPIIAGFDSSVETEPVGGVGIVRSRY
jgi:quinol monooxygenase YgiN